MQKKSIKILSCLAMVFAVRVFGLMLILPVISLYADSYSYNNKFLLGVCIGSYGLAQALLQIPIGSLSDRIGRKNTILLGLIVFIAGSFITCYAHTIYELIIGRVIQGCGAIGSTMLATVSDCSGVEERTKAMAFIGITIGASFFLSILLGPLIATSFGIKGILYLTFMLSIIAFLCAYFMLPGCDALQSRVKKVRTTVVKNYFDKDLCVMYFSIWILHLCYTAIFGMLPLMLQNYFLLEIGTHGKFYFISLIISLLLSLPAIYFTEHKSIMRSLFVASICMLAISSLGFGYNNNSMYVIYAAMIMFFAAFTFLESLLPSLVSRYATINSRGLVMGLFSSFQFFGIFTGGVLTGFIHYFFSLHEIFYVMSVLIILWLVLCGKIRQPQFTAKNYITTDGVSDNIFAEISNIKGVGEAKLLEDGRHIIVKVDKMICDINALHQVFVAHKYNIMH
jgi:MFS family permease